MIFCLTGLDALALQPTNIYIFSSLVESNGVEQETSHSVIFPTTVSVLWFTSTKNVQQQVGGG